MQANVINYKLINLLFLFILLDLLFIPKISYPIIIPISLPICFIIFFYINISTKNALLFSLCLICIIMSLIYGVTVVGKSNSQFTDDIKRAFQLISYSFYAAFSFKYLVNDSRVEILTNTLRVAFVTFTITGIYFLLAPESISNLISRFYPETIFLKEANLDNLRFSYILTDPNGAAYFFVMNLAIYLIVEKNNKLKILVLFCCVFIVFLTQSRGGLLTLVAMFSWFYFFKRSSLPKYFLPVFSTLFILFTLILLKTQSFSNVLELLQGRSEIESSLGGGRADKYKYWLNNFNILPWGSGYNLELNNSVFRPHSDLIRLNLSYGLVVTFIFLYFIWPKVKEQYALIIPFLGSFLINSMIDEYRLFGLFLIYFGFLYNLNSYTDYRQVR